MTYLLTTGPACHSPPPPILPTLTMHTYIHIPKVACFHSSGLKSLSWNHDRRQDILQDRWAEAEGGDGWKGQSEVSPLNPLAGFEFLHAVGGWRPELSELVKKTVRFRVGAQLLQDLRWQVWLEHGWDTPETGSCGSRPYTLDKDTGDLLGWWLPWTFSLQPSEGQMSRSWSWSKRGGRKQAWGGCQARCWYGLGIPLIWDSLCWKANVLHWLKTLFADVTGGLIIP